MGGWAERGAMAPMPPPLATPLDSMNPVNWSWTARLAILVMAGSIEIGRVLDGSDTAVFPFGIGVMMACFHVGGTRPVSRLALTKPSRI